MTGQTDLLTIASAQLAVVAGGLTPGVPAEFEAKVAEMMKDPAFRRRVDQLSDALVAGARKRAGL